LQLCLVQIIALIEVWHSFQWSCQMSKRYQLFINNEWVDPGTNEWFDSFDPFSGEAWAEIPRANAKDVDRAVQAGAAAMEGPWGKMSATDRGMLLYKLGTLIDANADLLADVESRDNGKLKSEVTGQVRYTAK
jgi:acyl-CoA reductase-like NAD-dependent aldehyde dehydrogenase